MLSAILAAFAGPRATLFDLPEGIAAAQRGEGGPLPGVSLIAGDAFSSVPQGGDLYLLRHLMHDYDDEPCVRILESVRRAMLPHARVLVLEKPIPTDDRPTPGRWLDLHVMLLTGGRERTVGEYERLLERAERASRVSFPPSIRQWTSSRRLARRDRAEVRHGRGGYRRNARRSAGAIAIG